MRVRKDICRGPLKIGILAFCLTTLMALDASAEERKLSGEEIAALLTDRTAIGEHRGKPTRQYFDPSGWTDYYEKGGRPDRGKWRVDKAKGQYCSQWGLMGGWSCYDVTSDGERFYWAQSGTDYHSPFTTVDGYQMKF